MSTAATPSSPKSINRHRFDSVAMAPPDPILGLSDAFKADPRPQKMNLSVGVYQDASGVTPILRCVKMAETKMLQNETSKGYLSIDGLADYRYAVARLVFGDQVEPERVAVVQTPGGTGAIRVAAEFIAEFGGGSLTRSPKVFVPSPTWANHNSIMESAHLGVDSYRYLASDKRTLDFEGLIEDLQTKAKPGDAILLHACCHNPTGVDPTLQQWEQIAEVLSVRGLLPFVDFAYQGFGDGIDADAAGLHAILKRNDEALMCSSFSKNFGLYSERVGAVAVVAGAKSATDASHSQLKRLVRSNYSNPPRHGGAIVATVLSDADLTSLWKTEVDEMRTRIAALRGLFVDGMKRVAPTNDFSFLLQQKGMFSFSGLNPMQVDRLRAEHAIYIVGSGRINVAGMNETRMSWLCDAVASVL